MEASNDRTSTVGRPSVEIYKSIRGEFTYRVIASAVDSSEQALRDAQRVALELEDELYVELGSRLNDRKLGAARRAELHLEFSPDDLERIREVRKLGLGPKRLLMRGVEAVLAEHADTE